MVHPVLLGDSIFDNAAYVERGGDVLSKLKQRMPGGWAATLNAIDGAVIEGVHNQLQRLPSGATHLIISAGGNNALREVSVLREGASSVADAVSRIAEIRENFAKSYRGMLDAALASQLPVALCTIYDAQLPDPFERRLASTALSVLNDAITREAAARRLPLIDLRVLFNDPKDYANAIEPSSHGATKIASVIVQLLAGHDFAGPATVYGHA